jgi:hypothetical protein
MGKLVRNGQFAGPCGDERVTAGWLVRVAREVLLRDVKLIARWNECRLMRGRCAKVWMPRMDALGKIAAVARVALS